MVYVDPSGVVGREVPRPFERTLKLILSPQTQSEIEDFTLIYSTLAPNGGCTDIHSHTECGELMVVASGTGKAWLAGEEFELKPWVAMYAPAGVPHKTMNTGDVPMRIICLFVPPAPAEYIRESIDAANERQ